MLLTKKISSSIKMQLVFSIGGVLVVLLILCAFMIISQVRFAINKVSDNYLEETAAHYATQTTQIIAGEYRTCKAMQAAACNYDEISARERRAFLNELMVQVLKDNPNFVDAWCVWEPNALDGLDSEYANTEYHDETGRFIPYWTNTNGKIECVALTDYVGSFWYENPLKSKKGILIEPNLYEVGGTMMWVCGVAFPVHDKSGKPVGVIGVDMSLDTLSTLLKSVQIYDTGYLSLISNGGLVAVEKDSSREGQLSPWVTGANTSGLFASSRISLESFKFSFNENSKKIQVVMSPIKVDEADEIWFLGLNVPLAEIMADSVSILRIVIICFILTLLLIIAISYYFIRNISVELNKGVDAMKNIAQGDGDLTVRMDIKRHNELGTMYKYFNDTMEKLQNSISFVKSATENMQNLGFKLADDMSSTAASANEITANIESVNKQIQRQSENVQSTFHSVGVIDEGTKTLSESIHDQSTSIVQASSSIEEMVANIRSVSNILEKNSETINNLERSSAEGMENIKKSAEAMSRIQEQSKTLLDASHVIQMIASQTNMLAMNAAIEASHAGESGKGFSVVADEIRKLAEDSSAQGKSITKNLKDIIKSIEDMSVESSGLQTKFDDIYTLTQQVSQEELQIKNAMQEQSHGGIQVLEAVRQLNDITAQVQTNGNTMRESAEIVSGRMNDLLRLTEEIQASMAEMAIGIETINGSMNNVNDLTQQNTDSLTSLGNTVSVFKV